ncbi:unnamed protein product [Caretta caretta]
MDPVRITVDNSKPLPRLSQYPLNPEAEAGIAPVISALKEQGIIVPCSSPCNTPILPVQKADGKSWQFVQDLRASNRIVIPSFPVVPNPATILASIPPNATHFTVVDFCSAFFSVPVHSESQYLFAFSYKGQQYTWTTLPQGYTESPSYFSQALARDLADLVFPSGSTLIQYVDDLLLCSPSLSASETDSLTLLTALANKGHKASRTKLQLCQTSVTYLGFLLSQGSRTLSPARVQVILSFPQPCSPRQVRKFLGMTGFCRQWIPQYASLAKPLQELTQSSVPNPMPWPLEANAAFISLKQNLASAPALGLPNYDKPFTLFCHEQSACALGVLTQEHGDRNRPVAYFSATLDPVAQGLPPCLRAVAAAVCLVEMSESLVLRSPLTLLVPHSVETLLLQRNTAHLSSARLTRYELLLLSASHITIKRCSRLNLATLLPLPSDGEPHDCLATVSAITVLRPDLFRCTSP